MDLCMMALYLVRLHNVNTELFTDQIKTEFSEDFISNLIFLLSIIQTMSENTTIDFIESYAEDAIEKISRKMRYLLLNKEGIAKDMEQFCELARKTLCEKKLETKQSITLIYKPYHVSFDIFDGYLDYEVSDILYPSLSKSFAFNFEKL